MQAYDGREQGSGGGLDSGVAAGAGAEQQPSTTISVSFVAPWENKLPIPDLGHLNDSFI